MQARSQETKTTWKQQNSPWGDLTMDSIPCASPFKIMVIKANNKISIECSFPDSYENLLKPYKNKAKGFLIKINGEDSLALCCEATQNLLHLSEFIQLIMQLTNQYHLSTELYDGIGGISEEDAKKKIAVSLQENNFEQAIEIALKAQEYGHFQPIWNLANQLEDIDSVETNSFDLYFNLYQEISENNFYYQESRQRLAQILLCVEPQGDNIKAKKLDRIDLLEKALHCAVESTHQPLIDKIFNLLCDRKGMTNKETNVTGPADQLIARAEQTRSRKFYTGMWKNEQKAWNDVQTHSITEDKAGPGYGF